MLNRDAEYNRKIREKNHIIVEGDDVPPPIANFLDMKIPEVLVKHFKAKRIISPTPIQIQGMPTA